MVNRDEAANDRLTQAPTRALKVYHSCLGSFTLFDVAMGLVAACAVVLIASCISLAVLYLGLGR